jgi:hypothetical protein
MTAQTRYRWSDQVSCSRRRIQNALDARSEKRVLRPFAPLHVRELALFYQTPDV